MRLFHSTCAPWKGPCGAEQSPARAAGAVPCPAQPHAPCKLWLFQMAAAPEAPAICPGRARVSPHSLCPRACSTRHCCPARAVPAVPAPAAAPGGLGAAAMGAAPAGQGPFRLRAGVLEGSLTEMTDGICTGGPGSTGMVWPLGSCTTSGREPLGDLHTQTAPASPSRFRRAQQGQTCISRGSG